MPESDGPLCGEAATARVDEIIRDLGYRLLLAMTQDAGERVKIVEARMQLRTSEIREVKDRLAATGTGRLQDSLHGMSISWPVFLPTSPELRDLHWPETAADWDVLVEMESDPLLPGLWEVVATAEKHPGYDSPMPGHGTDPL